MIVNALFAAHVPIYTSVKVLTVCMCVHTDMLHPYMQTLMPLHIGMHMTHITHKHTTHMHTRMNTSFPDKRNLRNQAREGLYKLKPAKPIPETTMHVLCVLYNYSLHYACKLASLYSSIQKRGTANTIATMYNHYLVF